MEIPVKRVIPKPIRAAIRATWYRLGDASDLLLGRTDALTPPRKLRASVGPGDFKEIGQEFLRYFVESGGLNRTDAVLDVGCGAGRMARPLTGFLDPTSRYEGFDVTPEAIKWCQRHISARFPHFRFRVADVNNRFYNPRGRWKASEYKFPYESDSFDFVFATSVFTHLLPGDAANYLTEVARVMKAGGSCLLTFFLLNEESLRLVSEGQGLLDFSEQLQNCRTISRESPESAVAYDESVVRGLLGTSSLRIEEPIRYGYWCGRAKFLSFQDIVFAQKV